MPFMIQRLIMHSGSSRLIVVLVVVLGLGCRASSSDRVKIRVTTPPDTPDTARVFLAGNLSILGSWKPDGFPLSVVGEGLWEGEFSVHRGEKVEFKVTLGSWESEAVYDSSIAPQNTVITVGSDTTIVLRPVTWRHLGFRPSGGITGTVRYHSQIEGEGLRYARDVIVWLPPSYESDPEKRYPVLYLHDGQNVIDPRTSYLGLDWRVDEIADSLIIEGAIREIIVVGCNNSPDRRDEYSDTKLGRAYAAFVIRRLKPMIDSQYRTLPDREHTAVMGSSMGGLISFLFVWWHPEVFSKAGCLSSAFEYDGGSIISEVQSSEKLPTDIRLYLDCGTIDLDSRLLPGYERMRGILVSKGMVEGADLLGFVDEGATHNEPAWAGRLWRPLTFLFGLKK
jgi:predicted alpha/beta superfamily hydrolase